MSALQKQQCPKTAVTLPTAYVMALADICCALLLLPLAVCLKHIAALSFKQRSRGVRESSGTFLMVPCTHTHTHIVLTLPKNLGTPL